MYMQIQVYDTLFPDTIRLLYVLFVVQSSTSAEPVLSNLVSQDRWSPRTGIIGGRLEKEYNNCADLAKRNTIIVPI